MGDFRRSKRSFGRRDSPDNFRRESSGRRDSGSRRESGDRPSFSRGGDSNRGSSLQMHWATCAECGKRCEVPFKPVKNKPVYCSDCFNKRDSGSGPVKGPSSGDLEEINQKLDKIMRALKIE